MAAVKQTVNKIQNCETPTKLIMNKQKHVNCIMVRVPSDNSFFVLILKSEELKNWHIFRFSFVQSKRNNLEIGLIFRF